MYLWQNYNTGLTETSSQMYKYKNKRILWYKLYYFIKDFVIIFLFLWVF